MIRILFILLSLITVAGAQDMQLVSYEEVKDCNYPSAKVCNIDDNGQESCTIVLNDKCK